MKLVGQRSNDLFMRSKKREERERDNELVSLFLFFFLGWCF